MDDIIIAIIGSITTILSAVITGLFAKQQIKQSEELVPDDKKEILSKTRRPLFWKIASIVTFFVGILLTIAFISVRKTLAIQAQIDKVSKKSNDLLKEGLDKKDYVLPSILMTVLMEKVGEDSSAHIEEDITIAYNSVYLKKIAATTRAFNEYYTSIRDGGEVVKLNGSDKEDLITTQSKGHKEWNMFFSTDVGDNRVIVSHFKVIYPSELKSYDSKFFHTIGPNEEEFLYPNDKDDIIGELVIMVSSSSLQFVSDIHSAKVFSLNAENELRSTEPSFFSSFYNGKPYSTVVARFNRIANNEMGILKLKW